MATKTLKRVEGLDQQTDRLQTNVADAISKIQSGGLTEGEDFQSWTPTAYSALRISVPDDWIYIGKTGGPAFQNGASAFNATDDICRLRKDADNMVWMEGLLTATTANNLFFQLPTIYTPKYSLNFAAAVSVGGTETHGRLRIIGNANASPSIGNVGIVGANPTTWGSICASFQADPSTGLVVPSCFPVTLPLSMSATPTFVLVSAVECSASGDALGSPVNLSLYAADFQVTGSGSSRQLIIRNVPGLRALRTFALSAFALAS